MKYQLEILGKKVENPKEIIVFVHGICHGAWCWEYFDNYFSEAGYQCYAVSLRGHGNSKGKEDLNTFTLSDYVEDVKFVVDNRCSKKPFLVGHSMGGAVVQQYIGGEYKDTVKGAVLFAPATAPCMKWWERLPNNKNLAYAVLIAWFGMNKKKIIHDAAFFTGQDKSGKKVQRIKDTSRFELLLQTESEKITGRIFKTGDLTKPYAKNAKNCEVHIPILVIGSYADNYFPEKSLRKTADVYAKNGKTALVILDRLCHDMMLDDLDDLAEPGWRISAKLVLEFIEDPVGFVKKHPVK